MISDAVALRAIAESVRSAATSADASEDAAAERALKRAEAQLTALRKRWAGHARVIRVARRPIERGRDFVAAVKQPNADREELGDILRAVERAVKETLAEAARVEAWNRPNPAP